MSKSTTERPRHGFVGLYFHTFTAKRQIQYQGVIVEKLDGGYHRVRYFSAWDGHPTDCAIVRDAEILTWQIYETAEEMRFAYYEWQSRQPGSNNLDTML